MLVLCSASEPSVGAGVSSFAGDTSLAELLVLARWLCQDVSCRGWRGRDVRVACPRRRPLLRQPWGTRPRLPVANCSRRKGRALASALPAPLAGCAATLGRDAISGGQPRPRGLVMWQRGRVCSSPSHGDCGASRLRSGVRAAMHAHGVGAAALYRPGRAAGPAAEQGEVGSRDAWGAHRCRRLRGYWRVLCLSVACERDIISVVSSKPISARHTSPIPQRYHPRGARSRRRGGDARGTVSACTTERTAKRRGAQRAAQRARRSRHAAAARPHPPGSAAARLLAARPELEPDRLVGVVRLWEKERPEGAGLICVPYTPGGRSSCGRSSQRRQPLFAPLRGARPSRAARPCSASV